MSWGKGLRCATNGLVPLTTKMCYIRSACWAVGDNRTWLSARTIGANSLEISFVAFTLRVTAVEIDFIFSKHNTLWVSGNSWQRQLVGCLVGKKEYRLRKDGPNFRCFQQEEKTKASDSTDRRRRFLFDGLLSVQKSEVGYKQDLVSPRHIIENRMPWEYW